LTDQLTKQQELLEPFAIDAIERIAKALNMGPAYDVREVASRAVKVIEAEGHRHPK
jgi:hypothetical protein